MKESTNTVSVSGGSNNKRHLSSRLDTRLISYMLAIFNFDMQTFNAFNAFDTVDKNHILPFINYSNRKEVRLTYSNSPTVTVPIETEKDQTSENYNKYLDYDTQELLGLISKNNKTKDD